MITPRSAGHPLSGGWPERSDAGRSDGAIRPRKGRMATERLSMRQIREILRQKWTLGRSHRAIAESLGISSGTVGGDGAPGPGRRAGLGPGRGARPTTRWRRASTGRRRRPRTTGRPRLRLPPRRAPQARRHPGAAPPRVPRAAPRRLSLHAVLRDLPPLAASGAGCRCARSTTPARSSSSTTPARSRASSTRRRAR